MIEVRRKQNNLYQFLFFFVSWIESQVKLIKGIVEEEPHHHCRIDVSKSNLFVFFFCSNTPKKHDDHARSVAGSSLSTASTSWLNRFIIRPTGVMSKNVVVGARITVCNKWLCKYCAALNVPIYNANVDINTENTVKYIYRNNLNKKKTNGIWWLRFDSSIAFN